MFIIEILKEIWVLFFEMAPYIMIGLIFLGILSLFFTKDLIVSQIGNNSFGSIFKAALFGVPLPLCSCGVIPTSVYLAKNGASKSSVISFLISTPQTGIDSIIATYGMLGWIFAIFRPIAALIMGIIGGIAIKFVDKKQQTNDEIASDIARFEFQEIPKKDSLSLKIKKMLKYSFVEFLDDIVFQFIVGLAISGLIAYIIPDNFFEGSFISNGIVGMLVMILIGIPMYVCATASIPIAITLMMKGFSPGVAFVFLAAGPATNAASLAILLKVLGKKVTATYLLVISICSLLFGLLLDEIFIFSGINPHQAMQHHIHNHNSFWGEEINTILGIIFLVLILLSVYRKYLSKYIKRKDFITMDSKIQKVSIEGMNCNHCVMNVKKAIESTKGVTSVDVKLNENAAYIEGNFDMNELTKSVESIGYKVI